MILLRVILQVGCDRRNQVLSTIRHIVGPTGVAPGCRSCHAYLDVEDKDSILYIEEWDNLEDLRVHLCDESFQALFAVLDLSCSRPSVQFETIIDSKGLEFVESVWKSRKNKS